MTNEMVNDRRYDRHLQRKVEIISRSPLLEAFMRRGEEHETKKWELLRKENVAKFWEIEEDLGEEDGWKEIFERTQALINNHENILNTVTVPVGRMKRILERIFLVGYEVGNPDDVALIIEEVFDQARSNEHIFKKEEGAKEFVTSLLYEGLQLRAYGIRVSDNQPVKGPTKWHPECKMSNN